MYTARRSWKGNWQEYIGFECVIVDGNSTDHTVIVAEEYKNKVNFSITISVEKDKSCKI